MEDIGNDIISSPEYLNLDIRRSYCSSKLPLESIRLIDGSDKCRGHYVIKRAHF